MRKELELKLAYLGKLVANSSDNINHSEDLINPILLSFASVGYKLDKDSIEYLKTIDNLSEFYHRAFKLLQKTKGDDVTHPIFYKNFPNLEEMTELDYNIRAILHYLTATKDDEGYMANEINEVQREKLNEYQTLDEIKIISLTEAIDTLNKYFTNLLEGKKIISEADKYLLEYYMKEYPHTLKLKSIPIKLNMVTYLNLWVMLYADGKKLGEALSQMDLTYLNTATDVLRFYAVLSNCDSSFDYYVKFKSLDRLSRRCILAHLDEIAKNNKSIMDDLASHEELWKKAFELLHVGEYAKKYPHIYEAAKKLRSDDYRTYNSLVEEAIAKGDSHTLYKLLSVKPGVFARTLDRVLRNDKFNYQDTLNAFGKIAKNISTTVLISLLEYYMNRNDLKENRTIMYREGLSYTAFGIDETRKVVSDEIITEVIKLLENTLADIYAEKPMIEDVYLSESLRKYMMPTNNRNASTGFKTLTFGTKVKIENPNNAQVLRLFTHWKNSDMRVDIDLSVEIFDADFNYVTTVGWHNMSGGKKMIFHSGDIVTAPEGASEFVDIQLGYARNLGRYAVVCNSVFSGQDFADIPECFSGVMLRNDLGKTGEVFEATTVKMKFDLTQKGSNYNLALAVDLETLELIWLDISKVQYYSCVVSACDTNLCYPLKKALEKHLSLYDLIRLHHKHLSFVDDRSDAKFIIDEADADLTPFAFDEIANNWI